MRWRSLWLLIAVAALIGLLPTDTMKRQTLNRLGASKSPYLLQHKDNPVHWYSWGEEAFAAARAENKPIFLSIGYSTCYWCHMMEKDSFERQDVAGLLNARFISIKVDREEHPDVDQLYMNAVVGMTGSGGWPLSVFLTPDLKPFFGGTFFWRAQFMELLSKIGDAWGEQRDKIVESGEKIAEWMRENNRIEGKGKVEENLLREGAEGFAENFDAVHGGFGGAPKFPPGVGLSFLLRAHRRGGKAQLLEMVEKTLDGMAGGGLNDDTGGGFHRYSTDAAWQTPHYEKMLYDQALLVSAYLEAYQVTGQERYAEVARQTLDYVSREMTHPEGGFYSAQDAGEVGKEGAYYQFSDEEKKLSREERLKVRSRRTPPHKDDKVLTAWNGLMLGAFAKAHRVLGEPRYLEAAQRSAAFLQTHLTRGESLLRRWREGEGRFEGTLDDYAFLISGLIELYESDGNFAWLERAIALQKKQDALFWDPKEEGYFFSNPTAPDLLFPRKEFYDGAIPAGNSVSALNLLKLHALTFDPAHRTRAAALLEIIAGEAQKRPAGYAFFLTALDFFIGPEAEIAVIGAPTDPLFREARGFLSRSFLPNAVTGFGEESAPDAREVPLLLRGKKKLQGKTTLYVCTNNVCKAPTHNLEEAKRQIKGL